MDRGFGFRVWGSGAQDRTSGNIYLETSLRHRWQASKHHVLRQPGPSAGYYRGLIIIRIGFVGPLYYHYNKEPPKQSLYYHYNMELPKIVFVLI